jgi:hypothetical protein
VGTMIPPKQVVELFLHGADAIHGRFPGHRAGTGWGACFQFWGGWWVHGILLSAQQLTISASFVQAPIVSDACGGGIVGNVSIASRRRR